MFFLNDKHTIMQQKVRLLILKHIKLEDIDMWFCGSWHLSYIFIMFSMYFIYMLEISYDTYLYIMIFSNAIFLILQFIMGRLIFSIISNEDRILKVSIIM